MKTLFAAAAFVALTAGVVYTQNPPLPGPAPAPPGAVDLNYLVPPAVQIPVAPNQHLDGTIDQTLDEIERVRAKKAELEKLEQDLVKQVQRKLEKQAERVNRLGLGAPIQPPTVIGGN